MTGQPKQANSATISLIYITVGALTDIWTAIYYYWIRTHPESASESAPWWCTGFFLSGLVLIIIGMALGRIGRAAREAEVTAAPGVVANALPAAPTAPGPSTPVAQVVPPRPIDNREASVPVVSHAQR